MMRLSRENERRLSILRKSLTLDEKYEEIMASDMTIEEKLEVQREMKRITDEMHNEWEEIERIHGKIDVISAFEIDCILGKEM